MTCQVSNAALETPYEVHGILCNVEKGSQPVLTLPEFLDGESSTTICEVRNVIPAPVIDIHVGNVLLSDVQQTDIFNGSSHTYTSTAKVTATNKLWNGKEMCCTRKSIDDFGIADHSICKNISIKYPPSNISMSVKTIQQKYNDSDICFINLSCETNESNPPCAIDWSSNRDDLRYIDTFNGTIGEHGSYRFVSNAIYIVANGMARGTITCSTRCNHFSSHLTQNYTVSFSCSQSHDIQTLFSTFRFPVNNVLIGAAVFCGLCIFFAIGSKDCVSLS
ncbi:uncharacterized protein LOC128235693 [Mya arenaria]|uniref:uncharacterized protein LOC128235693 n=1 Tax=Mya arenaria TaxID=6604 RepID=UPI0022E6AB8F|nr:uncharacterized protein LOC128235693 [Mya arenaria]